MATVVTCLEHNRLRDLDAVICNCLSFQIVGTWVHLLAVVGLTRLGLNRREGRREWSKEEWRGKRGMRERVGRKRESRERKSKRRKRRKRHRMRAASFATPVGGDGI